MTTRNEIKKMLYNYEDILCRIDNIRDSILYPYKEERDENVGGGRSGFVSKTVENTAIRLASNEELRFYTLFIDTLHFLFQKSSEEVRYVVLHKYLVNDRQKKSNVKIALELGVDVKRVDFLNMEFKKNLHLLLDFQNS